VKKGLIHILFLFLPVLIFSQTKIKSFYFENDKSIPTPYSQNQLALFKQSFNKGEISIFEIYSYTDSVGSVQYNDSLAKKRLSYVTNFLGLQSNSSVQLKPYGLVRKYDLTDYKSWRRVDIYYSQSSNAPQIPIKDSIQVMEKEVVDTIQEPALAKLIEKPLSPIENSIKDEKPYILNVEFIEGTAKMEDRSHEEIKKLYDYLAANPTIKALVRGHVCCGNNMRISKSRAKAVYRELVKLGISKSRLEYVGMSNNDPLVFPEKTNADRQRNRRVDVKFTKIDL
jgi:outer membrane protein OmpA-like peptidoglycan-associated protein